MVKEFREYGDRFDLKELKLGYLDLHGTNLENIANQRVGHLIQLDIFWSGHQSAAAFCKISNDLMEKEISTAIKGSLSPAGKPINRDRVIDKAEKKLGHL